ncbi:hypothetical protein BY996DRAFT_6561580 [Phakopsora pachyrhizi]|nr:hypothetical protein BY996DRAFT_6470724 [Phakopsora pachyrhizi]KAI8460273.1 hypothetical protein BY996DRAFT_6561580 [Phakopsora pachyrhizi]
MYEMIEGRNIYEDIRNNQAGKSAGVGGCLKMPLFWYAVTNHLRRPFYYFLLESMDRYLHTSSSYSGYPPFFMAFVNSNHYVKVFFKNKKLWFQSLENDLKLFQKLMPSASGGAVIKVD